MLQQLDDTYLRQLFGMKVQFKGDSSDEVQKDLEF